MKVQYRNILAEKVIPEDCSDMESENVSTEKDENISETRFLEGQIDTLEAKSKNLPNPIYCPELVPIKNKDLNHVVLYSGLIIPIFKYGTDIASSAI